MAGTVLALANRTRKRWTCPRCSYMNEPQHVNCRRDGCEGKRRKKPRRAHAEVLRGDTYALFVQAAADIHGVTDESCCACGKPRSQERRHDRDHDHRTGHARGLLCPGNTGCNVLLVPWISATVARAIYKAKMKAGEPDGIRWRHLAAYLERVEAHYALRRD